jgi:hypothetical protein
MVFYISYKKMNSDIQLLNNGLWKPISKKSEGQIKIRLLSQHIMRVAIQDNQVLGINFLSSDDWKYYHPRWFSRNVAEICSAAEARQVNKTWDKNLGNSREILIGYQIPEYMKRENSEVISLMIDGEYQVKINPGKMRFRTKLIQ